MSITVKSKELQWATVLHHLGNNLRGDCPFLYGQIINLGEKIAPDSDMSAFFVFAPSIIDKNRHAYIDIGVDYRISVAALYPIYESEIEIFHEIGLEQFWHHPNFDCYDVNRRKIE